LLSTVATTEGSLAPITGWRQAVLVGMVLPIASRPRDPTDEMKRLTVLEWERELHR